MVSPGDEVAGGRSAHHLIAGDVSDVGVGGRFNNNQIDQSSCAKKSSGLKCIAKQVIDIIKTATCMSYPQVASIVVQMNLKSQSQMMHDYEEGLCSQSNLLENDSCFDESNLATSAKKKKGGKGTPGQTGLDGESETPARRRSR